MTALTPRPFPRNVLDCLETLHTAARSSDSPSPPEPVGERLAALLPPPGPVLVVAPDPEDTAARFRSAGFSACGLATPGECSPDPLDTLRDDQGRWQAVVFQDSARDIDGIDLFDHASRLLAPRGHLLVLDAFAGRRDRPQTERLPFIEHFLRLAERFGFELQSQTDLTAHALRALDWRLDGLTRHAKALNQRCGLNEGMLDALTQRYRGERQRHAEGRCDYLLLKLQRQRTPDLRLGRIVGERQAQMRALFAAVFGHPMSEAHWQWKYGAGRGLGVGVWQAPRPVPPQGDDAPPGASMRLVAHYGGTTREVRYFGQSALAFQACDLMVAPSARRALTRQGPVFLVAATFLEHELGYGARHLLGIGFPNERAYRAPVHLGLYRDVLARIHEVTWPALQARPSVRLRLRDLPPNAPRADAQMNACWALMQASLGDFIVGVRDARYLRHRYFAHPDHSYRVIVVQRRLSARVEGLLVLRRIDDGGALGARCELLDAVGALHSMPVLVHHARRVAAHWGCTRLSAWLAGHLLAHFCLPADATAVDIGVLVPGNAWTAGPPIESLKERWWLTGGDTDFH